MTELTSSIRPSLFYKATCPPCRQLSRVAVALSLGLVRRMPLSSEQAEQIYASHPQHRGQLMLRDGTEVYFGLRVLRRLPHAVVRTAIRAIRHALRRERLA